MIAIQDEAMRAVLAGRRPPIPFECASDLRWTVATAPRWWRPADGSRKCGQRGCTALAVAEVRTTPSGDPEQWLRQCGEHAYVRSQVWVEDNQIVWWLTVNADQQGETK